MLEAVPKSWLSWDYDILENRVPVAILDLAWTREKGELAIAGRSYEIGREGAMSGAFFLRKGGETIASATKPSAFFRSFDLVFDQSGYTLKAASSLVRRFVLSQGSRVVGSVRPVNMFTRRAVVDLPEDFPLEVRVFITWLVIILWKRDGNSG